MVLNDDSSIAKYSCDSCRASKVTCSREYGGCRRCKKNSTECTYSRSGVIRRNRKRKNRSPSEGSSLHPQASPAEDSSSGVQCRTLSLPEVCATAGMPSLMVDNFNKISHFHLLDEHAQEWAQVFETFVGERSTLMIPAPPDVMGALRAGLPDRVRERAWLVIYFSIILGTVSCVATKQKIQHNLRFALSDVAVLLIPSELNVNALMLALSQSEFPGPSTCWMLGTSACRMFQALGNGQLDSETRERRNMQFWHLNLLDKEFAIIFGRTPTFHREMAEIGLPTLHQIQGFTSHQTSNGPSKLFGAHYMYQTILLSRVMNDIWHCLYGETKSERKTGSVNKDLIDWYDEAQKVLGAASLTEKPFCDAKNAQSIDIATHTIQFHFLYLNILLNRSSACMQEKCLDSCRDMLHLLSQMAPERKEPYHPTGWQLVCCPFTPFLILLCDLLSGENYDLDQKRESLTALEQLPGYLRALSSRNTLAARLEGISTRLVHHAQSHVSHVGNRGPDPGLDEHPTPRSATGTCYSSWGILPYGRVCEMDIPNPSAVESNVPASPILMSLQSSDLNFELDDDLVEFANSFDASGGFDWLSWDSRDPGDSGHPRSAETSR